MRLNAFLLKDIKGICDCLQKRNSNDTDRTAQWQVNDRERSPEKKTDEMHSEPMCLNMNHPNW